MTATTQTILSAYQVRKSKAQKRAFAAYLKEIAEQNGYTYREERGSFGATNLIVGDPSRAKFLCTAHYDTCARLPFPNFITPKRFDIYLLYQLLLTVLLLLPAAVVLFGLPTLLLLLGASDAAAFGIGGFVAYLALIATMLLILVGPANKHTANDNTSGVTVLVDTMLAMPPELRDQVTYVFFDLEEAGLFGSASYRAKHKKETKRQLLINFDCVSDGDHLLLVLRKGAHRFADTLAEAFPAEDGKLQREICRRGVFYPSDQSNFPCGVGVAALKKSRKLHILYMNRIHTRRDTVYEAENISYLKNGCIRLAALLSEQENI